MSAQFNLGVTFCCCNIATETSTLQVEKTALIRELTMKPAITLAMRVFMGLLILVITACGSKNSDSSGASVPIEPSLQYFGYALVDCGFDDPLDNVTQTNYITEVASFTNIAQMCVFDPNENILGRLQLMSESGLKALLSVQAIFFVGTPDATQGGGMNYDIHPQYQARWDEFLRTNNLLESHAGIAAFYVVDEPIWNGVSFAELKLAADAIKASFPSVPTAIIEAPAGIAALQVPTSIDWIGFDHYAIAQPDSDLTFKNELTLLKSKRSRASQKLLLIMDAQWLPFYGAAGYTESYMAKVAASYFKLAQSDPEVIGIVGYLWPGGLDDPLQKGARNLPQIVIDEHMRIGKLITGK